MVTTEDLQRLCDDAWDAAIDAANTFRPQLRIFESEIGKLVSKGSLFSVSKNSSSQTYGGYSPGNLTQTELARAWRQLINLFDKCFSDLVSSGIAAPTDEQVYESIKDQLGVPLHEARGDFSELRTCGGIW